jgi:hypothetical protein
VIVVSAPAKANGAVRREGLKDLTEDITALFTGRQQGSAAIADFDGRLDQIQKDLTDFKEASSRDLNGRLDQIQKDLADFKDTSSRGFWRKRFQVPAKTPDDNVAKAPDNNMDIARERTRARIAYGLIGALLVVVAATFVYVAVLSVARGLPQEDIINVTQGLGTTLLAPLVGLIGAVIGFYYGGQTAVQGAQQAAVASQKHTDSTQAVTETAQVTAKEATQAASQAATQATQTAKEATQTAKEATQVAKDVAQASQ